MNTDNNTNISNNKDINKLSPCCVCKETKKIRDQCIILNNEEYCKNEIEAHKQCLRNKGFKIY